MNFENALYYTLSTITQTLGGAIALSGAFVLLRYQITDARLHAAAVEALNATFISKEYWSKLSRLLSEGNYRLLHEELVGQANIADHMGGDSTDGARMYLHQMRVELKRVLELKSHFVFLLLVSIPAMALSAVCLALVPIILCNGLHGLVLTVSLTVFVTVLVQVAFLLYRQLATVVKLPS